MLLRDLFPHWPLLPFGAGGPDREGRDLYPELSDRIRGAHFRSGRLFLRLAKDGVPFHADGPAPAELGGEEFLERLVGLTLQQGGELPVPAGVH